MEPKEWNIPPGPGEGGVEKVVLDDSLKSKVTAAISEYGFNMVAAGMNPNIDPISYCKKYPVFKNSLETVSLDRYPADLRHEECKRWDYSPELPAVSVVLVFHNEGWATLVRTIHSVINFTPKELLEEVVLIDDGRKRIKIDIFDRNIYGLFSI